MLLFSRPPKTIVFLSAFLVLAAASLWYFMGTKGTGDHQSAAVIPQPPQSTASDLKDSLQIVDEPQEPKLQAPSGEVTTNSLSKTELATQVRIQPKTEIRKAKAKRKPPQKLKKKSSKSRPARFALLPDYRNPTVNLGRFEKRSRPVVDCRRELCPHKDSKAAVLMVGLAYAPSDSSVKFLNSDRLNLQSYQLSK